MTLIQSHRSLTASISETSTLPPAIYERLLLTHATSIEFLRQFYTAFNSGDPQRVTEIESLSGSLVNATARITAIAKDAEAERNGIIERLGREAKEMARLKGEGSKVRKINLDAVQGGGEVVRELMQPILDGLLRAGETYRRAVVEQSRDGGGGTPQPV
ncbi:putative RNA polymerase II transcription factor B subunit 1 [Cyphellophora attinorum]|uniref:Putative RNA polymerase II transcription factor B subunit 1 n=1 Tax=Cyphellophora attinorum TaxID=1664694 RepID=A0A0N0NMV4_9EURO|nr:putative RNA polymerase II transcription factor B subunit 1 [Phialophora attinorum]KPI40649.1 putative RNA polymerase II transcription factor B subunit 1 [Phialophora attinorum]